MAVIPQSRMELFSVIFAFARFVIVVLGPLAYQFEIAQHSLCTSHRRYDYNTVTFVFALVSYHVLASRVIIQSTAQNINLPFWF